MQESLDERQAKIHEWARECFGDEQACSLPHRGLRLLEEAAEAAQAAGVSVAMAHKLVDYVFNRPVGDLGQELGGTATTLRCLAQAAGLSAEGEEVREMERVLSKPREHFIARNAAKNAVGLCAVDIKPCDPPDACKMHGRCWAHSDEVGADSPGKAAYDRYCAHAGDHDYEGKSCPGWFDLPQATRDHWAAAAGA